jgi:hypothetical protein
MWPGRWKEWPEKFRGREGGVKREEQRGRSKEEERRGRHRGEEALGSRTLEGVNVAGEVEGMAWKVRSKEGGAKREKDSRLKHKVAVFRSFPSHGPKKNRLLSITPN